MPPKGMHPKAIAKQEREQAKANELAQQKAKAQENAKWGGEKVSKAELRFQEKQQKDYEKGLKKEMKKAINQDEEAVMASLKLTGSAKKNLRAVGEYQGATTKVTQFELQQRKEQEDKLRQQQLEEEERKKLKILDNSHLDLYENTNHLLKQQEREDIAIYGQGNVLSARNIDSALIISNSLSGADLIANDKGAQKRKNKRAYKDFEERRLPELRIDYPELKLSQLKEKCFKEFQLEHKDE